ncbi:Acetyltransferase YpeA [Novipirellula galeiformis]|uniref:Acetyltransferase YpeA n=1 Tax=Novipirellula galeiformis TaxID=2528004 RepID=A0A5C6CMM5_9BACT|nr:GNAT family N-acetyltransferase [Novipirellula galeiformis]TWU26183.1 Acetyltransferase YpeA [Novipirellula galeiformis]
MGLTYFKRFRMEFDLLSSAIAELPTPAGFELIPFSEDLIRDHATAKYRSFREELDANVFPCLGRRDGCLSLMREISGRISFIPEATWLIQYQPTPSARPEPIGTIQGLQFEGWGAIQNVGVAPEHRGRGLGSILLAHAAAGFRSVGLSQMHLEVTTDNTAAVRLYERFGFRRAQVVYKAAEVAGA